MAAWVGALALGPLAADPFLSVQPAPNQQLLLEWDVAGNPALEAAGALNAEWLPIADVPGVVGTTARLFLTPGEQTRFFRLRQTELTRVTATSPLAGEAGVAVTREVIVRFSSALAADALVGTDRLFATADGRRLLSRVELGTDRQSATLFFLEPVPAHARTLVTLLGTGLRDSGGSELDVDGDGQAGGTLQFAYVTAPTASVPNTAVSGRVYASERQPDGSNRPLGGVIITVDGAEETLRTTTDSQGFFQLNGCPAGRFFVHIDGRAAGGSAWPNGAYYPFVGKAWETIPGTTNSLPGGTGEIFLPLIPSGTLREVSPVVPTPITFTPEVLAANPSLAGVELVVPPNALYADSGLRGGRVGIAPVPPDRLPEPLPPGLDMALVITVQTDGPQNFSEPVPVRFPNLPDPTTGVKLPPGSKSGLWSFNHDTGRWELQGPMTVSADGNYLDTDAGVGIRQPGWHGNNPGSDTDDNAPKPPPDPPKDPTAPDPWKKCKSEITNLINAAMDCAYGAILPDKLIPDANDKGGACAVGVGLAEIGAIRDCVADPSGCKATLINNTGGALIGCSEVIAKSLGQQLKYIGPVAKVAGFIHGCVLGPGLNFCSMADCLEQSAGDSFCVPDEWETGMQRWLNDWDVIGNVFGTGGNLARVRPQDASTLGQAPPEFIAEAQTNAFFTQIRFTFAMRQLFVTFYGSEVWFQGSRAEAAAVSEFLRQLDLDTDPTSDGGVTVTATERAELMALPLPTEITEADAEALISRMERMFNGTLTNAEWNLRALLGSMVKYSEMAAVYHELGWDDQTEAYKNGLLQLSQRFEDRCQAVGGVSGANTGDDGGGNGGGGGGGGGGGVETVVPQPPRSLSYLLQNLDNGFELRGKIMSGASLGSLVFAPNTYYGLFFVDDLTGTLSVSFFRSAAAGQTTKIPCPMWLNGGLPLPDTDGDGLSDLAERSAGTSPTSTDTDGDGQSDQIELASGTSPLDGIARPNGFVGSAQIPSSNTLTVAAEGNFLFAGGNPVALTILDLSQPHQPVRLGSLPLSEQNFSQALAVQSGRAALGGPAGVVLVETQDPTAPTVYAQLPLGNVVALAWKDPDLLALAGNSLYVLDGLTGAQKLTVSLPETGDDIQVVGDSVYVLTSSRLILFQQVDFLLLETARITLPGNKSILETGRKLFVGGGRAYVGTFDGFSIVDVTNPATPVVLGKPPVTQAAIHDLTVNDAGLLVPVLSFAGANSLAVGAYDVRNPADVTRFITSWPYPDSRTVTLHQGLAYVAGTSAGVQTLNYLTPDLAGNAPTVSFTGNFPLAPARASYGQRLTLLVDARDDVQVRDVTAYLDDFPVAADGSFPFELHFTAPAADSGRTNFTLRIRAVDTAGNTRWTDPLNIALAVGERPPGLVGVFPASGGRADNFGLTNVVVQFDQPLDETSITAQLLTIVGAGADKLFGTADDVPRAGTVRLAADPTVLEVAGTNGFPVGLFRVTLAAGLRGTNLVSRTQPVFWNFETVGTRPRLASTTPSGVTSALPEGLKELGARLDLTPSLERAALAVFSLREAGLDRIHGNADDVNVLLSSVVFDRNTSRYSLFPATPLPAGRYRLSLGGSGFISSLVDFQLRPVPNEWINPAGGLWSAAGNWSGGSILANDFLRLPALNPGRATTNRTAVSLARVESAADFVQESGSLVVTGEAIFDGRSRFDEVTVGRISLQGGGRLVNRGTMQLFSSVFTTRAIEFGPIALLNRNRLIWESGVLNFTDPSALIFNEPSGTFDIGPAALRTPGNFSSTVGRIINAGLLQKLEGTNVVELNTVALENSGRIVAAAGELNLGELTGAGEIEIRAGSSVVFRRRARLPADARIWGDGNLSILGGSSNAPQVLVHRHELTGVTTAESNFTEVRRALDHPGLQFRSRNGWFRFFGPLNVQRLWISGGSFEGLEFNAPATTKILELEQGRLTGPASLVVTDLLAWKNSSVEAGGEISVQSRAELTGTAKLTGRSLRIQPGATFVAVSNTFLGTATRGQEGRLINEGTFVKRGAGNLNVQIKFENRGVMRFEEGRVIMERQPSGDGQFFPLTGELQFAGGELASYLQSFNGATFVLTNGFVSGYGKIVSIEGGFGTRYENRTLLRLNVPGKAFEVVNMDYRQTAAGELETTLGVGGCGRLVSVPTDSMTLGGRLRVVLEAGFVPELGQTFLICEGHRNGTFSTVELPDLGSDRKLEVSYAPSQVLLTVVPSLQSSSGGSRGGN